MRMFSGMILGAVFLLAAAYVYDTTNTGTLRADGTQERPMVNWDVVGRNAGNWAGKVQATVSSLINGTKSSTPSTATDSMEAPRPNAN